MDETMLETLQKEQQIFILGDTIDVNGDPLNEVDNSKTDILIQGRGNRAFHNDVRLLGAGLTSGGDHQVIFGKHNLPLNGDYVMIVGNGTSREKSNAVTLSDSGNLWLAGGLDVTGRITSEEHKIVKDVILGNGTLEVLYTDDTKDSKN